MMVWGEQMGRLKRLPILIACMAVLSVGLAACGAESGGGTVNPSSGEAESAASSSTSEASLPTNETPKYYELADFIKADPQYIVDELEAQGFECVDSGGYYCWTGSPKDIIPGISTDGAANVEVQMLHGRAGMSKQDVLDGIQIDAMGVHYYNSTYDVAGAREQLESVVASCGLNNAYALIDRAEMMYVEVGTLDDKCLWEVTVPYANPVVPEYLDNMTSTDISITAKRFSVDGNLETYINKLNGNGTYPTTML